VQRFAVFLGLFTPPALSLHIDLVRKIDDPPGLRHLRRRPLRSEPIDRRHEGRGRGTVLVPRHRQAPCRDRSLVRDTGR